jgi:serine acetyltransferase
MWSELSADAKLYGARRWPGGGDALGRALIWIRSLGLLVLAFQRLSHHYRARRERHGWTVETIALRALLAIGRWPVSMIAKCDVAESTVIGRGVYLSDGGFLVLGPQSIGSGTLIHERVTIGVRAGERHRPVIGENVWIGPDCVIYGNIVLGDGATVLPGSVVSMTVSDRAVVGGNPATVVRRNFDNSGLRLTLATDVDRESLVPR